MSIHRRATVIEPVMVNLICCIEGLDGGIAECFKTYLIGALSNDS